jgi:hypothetical protein
MFILLLPFYFRPLRFPARDSRTEKNLSVGSGVRSQFFKPRQRFGVPRIDLFSYL